MVTLRLVSDDEPGPLAQPEPGECVACFLDRMVGAYGCSDRLTWAGLWRDRAAPRASSLERRLRSGGGYCDCEVLMNVFARRTWLADRATVDDADPQAEPRAESDAELPPCLGVRKGSTRPCDHWA